MALIKCEDCGASVSDKATSCPHCGCPIKSQIKEISAEIGNIPFPSFPTVMNVGKQITNWGFDAALQDVLYSYSLNKLHYIPEGKVSVLAHTNGICIWKGITFFYIHHNQIIDIKCIPYQQFEQQNKSVIGRAVVGGLILGPLGAIVGGMSGIGTKLKNLGKFALVIPFWDVYTHELQTIMIACKNSCDSFVRRVLSEKEKNNIAEGKNYSINIFKSRTEIDDKRVIEALSETGIDSVTAAIAKNGSIPTNKIEDIINETATKNNFDLSQVKKSGCIVTAITIISGISSLIACFVLFF